MLLRGDRPHETRATMRALPGRWFSPARLATSRIDWVKPRSHGSQRNEVPIRVLVVRTAAQ
jgi:hypothetical protein